MAKGLSAAEFAEAIQQMDAKIAVFDCDGTLWAGDAGSHFMRWSMETGLLSAERAARLNARYERYRLGEVSELAICGEMVQVYAGLEVAALRAAARRFFAEHVEQNIFAEMRAAVRTVQERGAEIWAVSSTCDWVIEEGVTRFGIAADRVLAARVRIENGRATDELVDVPTDEGKVAALRVAGVTAPDAVFGNSVHDAAMLAIARRPFAVNPSPELEARAGRDGWAMFWPGGTA